jgi:hypothetical protein
MTAQKVRTSIEVAAMQFSNEAKEQISDFVMLYANKTDLGVDRAKLLKILEVVQTGADQAFQKQMEPFSARLDAALTAYETEMVAALTAVRPKGQLIEAKEVV